VNTHSVTEATRAGRLFAKGHEFEGHLRPPMKGDAEGGQAFANRCDDFIILHRLTQHAGYKLKTMVHVVKVKNKATGGEPTDLDNPLIFDYNRGLGFVINGVNPLTGVIKPLSDLPINHNFDSTPTIEKGEQDKDDSIPF